MTPVDRRTVDLSAYPDLLVVILGMRVNAWTGLKRLLGLGPQIAKSARAKPTVCCFMRFSILAVSATRGNAPILARFRIAGTLDTFRTTPRRWRNFLRDSGGTGFWHETYSMRGGIEAIYDDMAVPVGMMKFAPLIAARGSCFPLAIACGARAQRHRPLLHRKRSSIGMTEARIGRMGSACRRQSINWDRGTPVTAGFVRIPGL